MVKFNVKLRNIESLTKKRSSEILADEKTIFDKSHTEKCNLQTFS